MTQDPDDEPLAQRILDVAVFAPVGLALSVAEAVPGLVQKGRDRLAPQVNLARTVGQLAVNQGYRQVVGFTRSRGLFPFGGARPNKSYTVYPTRTGEAGSPGGAGGNGAHNHQNAATEDTWAGSVSVPPAEPVHPPEPTGPPARLSGQAGEPRAAALAIPSYDSLSATQVVQRLAGLSREEVAAVAAYEAATRRRKTVLSRAEQLLKAPGGE